MALKYIAVALAVGAMASPCIGQTVAVEIFNNTIVDLCIEGKSKKECTEIRSNQTVQALLRSKQWIQFGMEAHEYRIPQKLITPRGPGEKSTSVLKLQAEKDGKLYFVPSKATFPVFPLPRQPAGFPLKPAKVVDLT